MYYFISEHKQNMGRIKFAKKKYSKVFLFQQKINLNSFLNPLHMSVVIHVSVERILAKGQLIWKGLFGIFNSSKKRTKTSQPEVSQGMR